MRVERIVPKRQRRQAGLVAPDGSLYTVQSSTMHSAGRCSSAAEQGTHKPLVAGSIPATGT